MPAFAIDLWFFVLFSGVLEVKEVRSRAKYEAELPELALEELGEDPEYPGAGRRFLISWMFKQFLDISVGFRRV